MDGWMGGAFLVHSLLPYCLRSPAVSGSPAGKGESGCLLGHCEGQIDKVDGWIYGRVDEWLKDLMNGTVSDWMNEFMDD